MKKPALVWFKGESGFTFFELLVVLTLIAILSVIITTLINSEDTLKKNRDSNRMFDIENIQNALQTALADSSSPAGTLCHNLPSPCSGLSSDTDAGKNDGTGWVKTNFAAQVTLTVSTLPVDPVNNSVHHYSYYSDGKTFELNTIFESDQYREKMSKDGGNNDDIYEIGTNLSLIH